jgi:chorismate dehydratase
LHANLIVLSKIKVGAVSYLNTKPLLFGVKRSGLMDKIDLIEDYPASIAAKLLNNEIDVGLVPVAVIPKMQEHFIVTNYCIGAVQAVASVCLFSQVPIDKIEKVILDYQSKTSVNLCKILLQHYWKKEVVFEEAIPHLNPLQRSGLEEPTNDYRNLIKGTTAAVVIGDRAFEQRNISPYVYDLAEAWIDFTKLPFVFAVWVANKKLNEDFIDAFSRANAYGLQHINEVVAENPYPLYDLKKYYTQNISYHLDEDKTKGLALFLQYLQ